MTRDWLSHNTVCHTILNIIHYWLSHITVLHSTNSHIILTTTDHHTHMPQYYWPWHITDHYTIDSYTLLTIKHYCYISLITHTPDYGTLFAVTILTHYWGSHSTDTHTADTLLTISYYTVLPHYCGTTLLSLSPYYHTWLSQALY